MTAIRLLVARAIMTSLSPTQRAALGALLKGPLHRVRKGWCHDLGGPAFGLSTLMALQGRRLADQTGLDRWEITETGRAVLAADTTRDDR